MLAANNTEKVLVLVLGARIIKDWIQVSLSLHGHLHDIGNRIIWSTEMTDFNTRNDERHEFKGRVLVFPNM